MYLPPTILDYCDEGSIAALYYVCHNTRRMIRDDASISAKQRRYAYIECRGIIFDSDLRLVFHPSGDMVIGIVFMKDGKDYLQSLTMYGYLRCSLIAMDKFYITDTYDPSKKFYKRIRHMRRIMSLAAYKTWRTL
jgi:hypothetical protein